MRRSRSIAMTRGCSVAAAIVCLPATFASAMVSPPPPYARVLDFDDSAAPAFFFETTALRDQYAPVGVRFRGIGELDGGAILNDTSFSAIVSGYSPPNVLGFNENVLQDEGVASLPGTIEFLRPVSHVQINVTNPTGTAVTMEAFGADDSLLTEATVVPQAAVLTTLTVQAPGIVRVQLSSEQPSLLADDLAFVLDATRINFDDLDPAPNLFTDTTALRDRYAALGVRFFGNGNDGGAVLSDDFFNFTGYSPPNFLAFFSDATSFFYTDGGKPTFPQVLEFDPPVRRVEFHIASDTASTLNATAFDRQDNVVTSAMVETGAAMMPVVLEGPAIWQVVIGTTGSVEAIDDLSFLVDGTVIDFDDLAPAPAAFADAEALRDRYLPLGVAFRGDGDDGGAIVDQDQAGFSISGFSPPNVLGFAMGGVFEDGSRATFPETLLFDPPIRSLQFRVGFALESTITAEAFDATGASLGSSSVDTTSDLKTLPPLVAPGAVRVEITSNGSSAFFDDFVFAQVDPCAHDVCLLGTALDNTCDGCVTRICANDSFCCEGAWDVMCRGAVASQCESPCPDCAHDVCSEGAALDARCDPCVAAICAADPFCCSADWDLQCVNEVLTICALTCPPPPCEHSYCIAGTALVAECDSCVAEVCAADPSCCSEGWDTDCMLRTVNAEGCGGAGNGCDVCGDANRDGKILTGDALQVLRAAVGNGTCIVERCDYNNDGKVLSGDALAVLRAAVGQPTSPQCPSV